MIGVIQKSALAVFGPTQTNELLSNDPLSKSCFNASAKSKKGTKMVHLSKQHQVVAIELGHDDRLVFNGKATPPIVNTSKITK